MNLEVNIEKKRVALVILVIVGVLGMLSSLRAAQPSDTLIKSLELVESSGNTQAIGDRQLKHKAYGLLQIRQPCVDDVNRRLDTSYRAEQCLGNRELSILIFRTYVQMYGTRARLGHEPTDADYARIWNGGPNGWKNSSTLGYLAKMEKAKKKFSPPTQPVPRGN